MLAFVIRRHSRSIPAHFRPSNLFSSSSAASAVPPLKPFSVVEYLVDSWGLSAAEASKVSRSLSDLKSSKKPDYFFNFLKSQGFTDSHIKRIINVNPRSVCVKVEPKFRSWLDAGISQSDLVEIITSYPRILHYSIRSVVSSVEKRILPNLKFLMDVCGISEEKASRAMRSRPELLAKKLDSLQTLVRRADELGVPRQSPMYPLLLIVLYGIDKEKFEAKSKFFKSLGWSESDFFTAVRTTPTLLTISQPYLQRKMEFFVKEVGYSPSFITQRPLILLFSLDKRVIPRFQVLELLKSENLWTAKGNFFYYMKLSDKKFIEKFVIPYKEKVPKLVDIYSLPSTEVSV
ncbi:transcription termination factor MTERF15, mitochondrial-like isoform X2 [Zingiber officinale]|uniref:transcription termination factor MTERF15, mitochondrial-like isoform X2 n=1 Tax=Zingiber officinale TaxID=94328 RepID=UPI001C4C6E5F|nr:transcription termination factor MTERF15, mitochondrial-like isoform X2 [Zingiber officinale]